MSKNCKHNNMSQVLPGLWIGGTKKHTIITEITSTRELKIRRVVAVETKPDKSPGNVRHFVCKNYGIPDFDTIWWQKEITEYRFCLDNSLTTIVTDLGGHGRSGLYCAILMAHVLGISGQEAIARLRQLHCEHAVETAEQEAYVIRIADELKDWKG